MWIAVRPTENDSTRLYKYDDSQLLLAVASSNLVGRKPRGGTSILEGPEGGLAPKFASKIPVGAPNFASII